MPRNFDVATIYKSNGLIEAGYRLSVTEQRILLACISQVRHDEPITDEVMYTVTAASLAELSEVDQKTIYRDLMEASLRLKHRDVRIYMQPNNGKKHRRVLICSWVQSIEYIESEGRISLRLNKDIVPYLNGITSRFTKYSLKAVAKMESAYAIRLYEIMIQWLGLGSNAREIEISWLRDIFQLEDKYPAVKDFKKWVIDAAITQINELSDIQASYTAEKTGRRITHLIFSFAFKEDQKAKTKKGKAAPKNKKAADEWAAYVKTNARPGESWEQAETRLRAKYEAKAWAYETNGGIVS